MAKKRGVKKAEKKRSKDLIDQADASFKASEEKKKSQEPITEKATAVVDHRPKTGVTHIVHNPSKGSVTTKYPSLSYYAKANPEKSSMSTISGHDPKTETLNQIIDKSVTYGEMKDAEPVSNELKGIIEGENKNADAKDFSLDISEAEQARLLTEEGNRNTEAGYSKFPGEGGSLGEVARSGSGGYTMTDDELMRAGKEHRIQNAAQRASAPVLAIEKMGIEHYYPPQQDFITSNFSGRYIGSRQLVAATGGLFPEGLVDARKRALQAKAASKAENDNKYWELTDTAPQYDERYKDIGMDMLNKYYDLSGGDVDGLISGNSKLAREFQRDMYDYKSRGKNLEYVNTSTTALIEKMNKGDEYIPPEIIKNMYDFRAGTADLDSYMEGKAIGDEKVRRISNTLRSYQNFTPLANKQLELLNSLGADSLPLNKNADFSDPKFAANMSEAISSTKNKGVGYDEYSKIMGEFYDVKAVEEIVNDLYRTNNLYEGTTDKEYQDQVQNGVKYFMAMLPDKIDIEQKFQANQSLGWANLAQKKMEFNKQSEWKEREWESMWDGVNNELLDDEKRAKVSQIMNSSDNPETKRRLVHEYLTQDGKTAYNLGGAIVAYIPTKGKTVATAPANRLSVLGNDGKLYSINKLMNVKKNELDRLKNKGTSSDSKYYQRTKQEYLELQGMSNTGNKNIEHRVEGRFAGYGVYDTKLGAVVPVESYKGSVDPSDLINMGYETGKVGIDGAEDEDGNKTKSPSLLNYVNKAVIEDDAVRRAWANRGEGEELRKRAYPSEDSEVVGTSSTTITNP